MQDDKDSGFQGDPAAKGHIKGPSLATILGFEFGLGLLALALALIFGLRPWLDFAWGWSAWLLGLVATLPMLAGMLIVELGRWQWVLDLKNFVQHSVVPWFARMRWWGLALVALSAGVGEELLFRGVIQAGLAGPLGPIPALILASLLFGLVHAMSRTYFLITFLAGLYLGWLYWWTGNLLIPIIVHFLYDWAVLQYCVSRYGDTGGSSGRSV